VEVPPKIFDLLALALLLTRSHISCCSVVMVLAMEQKSTLDGKEAVVDQQAHGDERGDNIRGVKLFEEVGRAASVEVHNRKFRSEGKAYDADVVGDEGQQQQEQGLGSFCSYQQEQNWWLRCLWGLSPY
jgi:hypothetical protein